ncbi:MAG: type IV secretion protein DotI [Gammaproteobacteria bacterium]|nr:type IV secretion protein DotI [Gammaproteobacteria bacterium]MCP4475737.1 type IV secretion protein DotI [Gammaproteobacteria bacterium]
MAHDALETVKLRNNFYRDSYRRVVMALIVALVIIAGLTYTVYWQVSHRPMPKYFASTANGRIIPLIPLNSPNMNTKAIRSWAVEASVAAYSYNFVNFRQVFNDNQKYFTSNGWDAFLKQLQSSGNLNAVQKRKLIVSAVPRGVPVIQNQGVLNGRYFWRVQVPMLVTYQSQSETIHSDLLATLTIRRISTLTRSDGIGIDSFVAQQVR